MLKERIPNKEWEHKKLKELKKTANNPFTMKGTGLADIGGVFYGKIHAELSKAMPSKSAEMQTGKGL